MTSPKPTKGVFAVAMSLAIIATNLFVTTRFVVNMRRFIDLQTSGAIQLPIARPTGERKPVSAALELTLHADGTIFHGPLPIEFDSIAALLQPKSPQRIVVHAERGVPYPKVKALLGELHKGGADKVILETHEAR